MDCLKGARTAEKGAVRGTEDLSTRPDRACMTALVDAAQQKGSWAPQLWAH